MRYHDPWKGVAAVSLDLDHLYLTMEYMNHRRKTPGWVIDYVVTHFIDVTYVVGGRATYVINGVKYEVGAGDLICIPQGSQREATCDPDLLVESYCTNFQLYDYRTREDVVLPFQIVTHIGIRPNIVKVMESLHLCWTLREQNYLMMTSGYMLTLLGMLLSLTQYEHQLINADQRVYKAVRYILDHSGENITVNELAQRANLHPIYFASLFRKSLGMTVSQYLRRIRVNAAEALLEEGVYNVTEVAGMCGFCDVYYFSRIFKEIKGYSPSSVRK